MAYNDLENEDELNGGQKMPYEGVSNPGISNPDVSRGVYDAIAGREESRRKNSLINFGQAISGLSQGVNKPLDQSKFYDSLRDQATKEEALDQNFELKRQAVADAIARRKEDKEAKEKELEWQHNYRMADLDQRKAQNAAMLELRRQGQGFSDKNNRALEVQLAQALESSQPAKDMQSVAQSMLKLQQSTQRATPMDDVATVYNMVKMMDPPSVVREGEIDLLRAAQGPAKKYAQMWENLTTGNGVLSPEMRQEIAKSAAKQYQATNEAYENAAAFYRDRAIQYGLDPNLVARNYAKLGEKFKTAGNEPKPKMGEAGASETPAGPKIGDTMTDKNGKLRQRTERGWELVQ